MAKCETQIFSGVAQLQFDCLVQEAFNEGIAISGNEGEASKNGIAIRWSFDAAAQSLELQCLSSPFYLPCGVINRKIQDLLASCRPMEGS